MSNPYREAKNRSYVGEYYEAVFGGEYREAGTEYAIYQLQPKVWICQTNSYGTAVELVNRLDTTGEEEFGNTY